MYINTPNIPDKQINSVLVNGGISAIVENTLSQMSIMVHKTKSFDLLMPQVRYHPDMAIHHISENIFVTDASLLTYYQNILPNARIIIGNSTIHENYPFDIAYNIARVGKYAFHKLQYTDKVIYEYLERFGVTLVNVNQGYSKCSVCILNDHAIITADKSIAKVCNRFNIDVLQITNKDILLSGFDYGFIGGATGLIAPDKLAVYGDLKMHSDYERIELFCEKYNIQIIPLHNGHTEDIGSIIPLY